jgi:hypothetical protein
MIKISIKIIINNFKMNNKKIMILILKIYIIKKIIIIVLNSVRYKKIFQQIVKINNYLDNKIILIMNLIIYSRNFNNNNKIKKTFLNKYI